MKKNLTQAEKIAQLQKSIELSDSEKRKIYEMKMHKLYKSFDRFCREGDFDMIKYMLTSPDMELNYDLHHSNSGFNILCEKNNIPVITYLLTSPELKNRAKIRAGSNVAIEIACSEGHLELVKFLLTSPALKEHANIYDYQSRAVLSAYQSKNKEIMEYLVNEYKLDFNLVHESVKEKMKEIEHRAALNDLKNNLDHDLALKETQGNKMKI